MEKKQRRSKLAHNTWCELEDRRLSEVLQSEANSPGGRRNIYDRVLKHFPGRNISSLSGRVGFLRSKKAMTWGYQLITANLPTYGVAAMKKQERLEKELVAVPKESVIAPKQTAPVNNEPELVMHAKIAEQTEVLSSSHLRSLEIVGKGMAECIIHNNERAVWKVGDQVIIANFATKG